MARITAVFVFPILQDKWLPKALETLYQFTPIEFRVVVVDNTKNKSLYPKVKDKVDLWINTCRNFGFAKSMNEGIIHGLHWGADYVIACNDDVEFLDSRWWQGIMDQFKQYPEMLAVNPASVIEPGWGYGVGVPGHTIPDWGIEIDGDIYPKKPDGTAITYEDAKTKKGYDMLLAHRQGHIEGFAGWCVVAPRTTWENVGLYEERLTPGGGDDYELVHRIYIAGGRASATLRSFVWHWWGKSKEIVHTSEEVLSVNRVPFQNADSFFIHSPDGANSPIYPPRDNEPYGNKRKRKSQGIFIDDPR